MMFFFRKNGNGDSAYHWYRECGHVPASVGSNPDWMMSNLPPRGRGECPSCKRQEENLERDLPAKDPEASAPISPTLRRR